jgi:hypothetical protein
VDNLKLRYNEVLKKQDEFMKIKLGEVSEGKYNEIQEIKCEAELILNQLINNGYQPLISEILNGFKELEVDLNAI